MPTSADRTCIAVIDESDSQSVANMESRWTTFRTNWPNRTFYLLNPRGNYGGDAIVSHRTPPTFLEETDSSTIDI